MNEMIERVARALWKSDYPAESGGEMGELFWDRHRLHYCKQARAAIEEMRVPTPEVLDAAGETPNPHATREQRHEEHLATWQAMIDEALKDE